MQKKFHISFYKKIFCASLLFFTVQTHGIPSQVTVPPPIIAQENGFWIPPVNQFMLLPLQEKLQVYYVGMFSNTYKAKGAKIWLPFPDGVKNFQLLDKNSSLALETNAKTGFVLNNELQEGVNQVRATFEINAPSGKLEWISHRFKELTGVSIFVMPKYESFFKDVLFPPFMQNNFWPPRLIMETPNYKEFSGVDPFVEENNQPIENTHSIQWVRAAWNNAPYPQFQIVGIAPSLKPFYILIIFISLFLLSTVFYFLWNTHSPTKKQKTST